MKLAMVATLVACSSSPCTFVSYDEAEARFGSAIARCGLTATQQSVFGFAVLAAAACDSKRICAADVDACEARIRSSECSSAYGTTCKLKCE